MQSKSFPSRSGSHYRVIVSQMPCHSWRPPACRWACELATDWSNRTVSGQVQVISLLKRHIEPLKCVLTPRRAAMANFPLYDEDGWRPLMKITFGNRTMTWGGKWKRGCVWFLALLLSLSDARDVWKDSSMSSIARRQLMSCLIA